MERINYHYFGDMTDGERPRSETVKLTKTARERFDRQLAERLPDIFTALFEAGTKEKDTAALSLLVNRAVPVRKGVPVNFKTRPLSNPTECASGNLADAIAPGAHAYHVICWGNMLSCVAKPSGRAGPRRT